MRYLGPIGSLYPMECSYLAVCQQGAKSANKFFILVFFVALLAVIFILFKIFERLELLRNLRLRQLMPEIHSESESKKMKSPGRQFNIEFENLSLVLPNDVTIVSNVSGQLRSGRTCAVMGPSGSGKTTYVIYMFDTD
jgi:ABC-type bacteriocin/lantibiotic exporter with double-glycine peptidase domain